MPHLNPRRLITLAVAMLVPGAAVMAQEVPPQGEFSPPAGAPSDSGKSINQVEPRTPIGDDGFGDGTALIRITEPGSYYLVGDIRDFGNLRNAIRIESTATEVTIDLNGFTIQSPAPNRALIEAVDGVTQLTVRNGVLGGGSSGIESRAGNTTVEDVSFIGGSGVGARLFPNAVVRRSTFRDYFGGGLIVVRASDDPFSTVIEDCTFTRIGPTGSTAIAASDLTTIRNVTVEDCGSGISVGDNSSVTDVRIAQMLGRAVTMGNNCSLTGFTISRAVTAADSRDGVLGGDECLIKDGTFTNYLGTGSMMTLARNAHVSDTILRNATAAGANGLRVSTSSTILDCSIDDANNIGLAAGSYCTIRGNSIESRFFGGTAIQVDGRCLIDGNRTFGDIEYTGVENVIVRNSIESGDIVENGTPSTNTVGPLNDLTSPWANFRR